jgi:hypothetical protein
MRVLTSQLSVFIGLFLVIFSGPSELWARAPILDWRTFEVPEYGTRVEYPGRIFAPQRKRKRVSLSASKAPTVVPSCLFTPAGMTLPTHLSVI